jgi:hypothetical protein
MMVWSAMLLAVCVSGFEQFAVTPGGGGYTPQCAAELVGKVRAILLGLDSSGIRSEEKNQDYIR